MTPPIGLQLYSLRDPLSVDYEGALREVARMGFRHVELAGLHGHSVQQVRGVLDRLSLRVLGMHVPLDVLVERMGGVISQAKAVGADWLVCPYLDESYRNPVGYRWAAEHLNRAAQSLVDEGLSLGYHNHAFEFDQLEDGSRGFEVLAGELERVGFELDVAWVVHAGEDPVVWIERLVGRLPWLHIKDLAPGAKGIMTEVGCGVVDIPAVVAESLDPVSGVRGLIIEQDANWTGSPLTSVRTSLGNLQRIVAALLSEN